MSGKHLQKHLHAVHPDIIKRLKRANGHLQNVICMMEEERPCLDIAQQLYAVERAIIAAKKLVIHDHLDHCLVDVASAGPAAMHSSVAEFKDITKYL